ncbi:hypothetical protein [Noviherbaspirillum aerium]|uniref:hypothetical protein n=1 Tax=Noviherbaspirillum aerium TaxID=2588497 RepID=UPI00124E3F90|nr:hypothetical protein [Noviherbaspirillum aerium]
MKTSLRYRIALAASVTSLLLASSPSWAQSGAANARSSAGSRDVEPANTLIFPGSQPDPLLYNGCWVQLMDNVEKPKGKEYLTIVGSKYMPALVTASGKNWAGRADGISIGPNAMVKIYGGHAYTGRSATLQPNQIVQDLRAEIGLVDSIDSMQIECRNS